MNLKKRPYCQSARDLSTFIYALFFSLSLTAAEQPNHDIVLFELSKNEQGFSVDSFQQVASSPHYDNQPFFAANGKDLFFTHIQGTNADIWKWDAKSGKTSVYAKTELSEYSPTVIPFEQTSLSTVRVEADGTQRLWKLDKTGEFSMVFGAIKPVGYHAWSEQNIAMFVLGEPHELHISHFGSQSSTIIDKDIGRSMHKVPGKNAISYTVAKNNRQMLKVYDFDDKSMTEYLLLPEDTQDYVWYDESTIISSKDGQLFYSSIHQPSWKNIENLSKLGLSQISRLAISPDLKKLAVVYVKP
ncbi:hypothetical protein FLL45_02780 [Aliikangiella marina]|uniref:WD40 repeat domain-containing protein n=1 Tax=Aliikangiella marina TaxID=1712262 RepID=A0A545TI46_9GAMM|nr:hypothetical protein [Aliikangiella marina]TQV76894.1 hypothetical protein FLL45_02780 [Aliikangiella marina]